MDEEKPKKKRRKAAADGEGSEPKEHKKNWREEYATDILQMVGSNPVLRLTANLVGRAMTDLGFERVRSHGERGYVVVPYSAEEIEANRRLLASDAEPENETAGDSGDSAF